MTTDGSNSCSTAVPDTVTGHTAQMEAEFASFTVLDSLHVSIIVAVGGAEQFAQMQAQPASSAVQASRPRPPPLENRVERIRAANKDSMRLRGAAEHTSRCLAHLPPFQTRKRAREEPPTLQKGQGRKTKRS